MFPVNRSIIQNLLTLLALSHLPLLAVSEMPPIGAGDGIKKVYASLGEPSGVVEKGGHRIMIFDSGRVTFEGDRVVGIQLKSKRALAREAARIQSIAERNIERRDSRRERGLKLKAERLTDPQFRNAAAPDRLHFWKTFLRIYPEVDVSRQVETALSDYERLLARKRREQVAPDAYTSLGERSSVANSRSGLVRYRSPRIRRHGHVSCGSRDVPVASAAVTYFPGSRLAPPGVTLYPSASGVPVQKTLYRFPATNRSDDACPVYHPRAATPPNRFPTFFASPVNRFPQRSGG